MYNICSITYDHLSKEKIYPLVLKLHSLPKLYVSFTFSQTNQNMHVGICPQKIYFKIDQHLARHFVYYVEYLSSHPPFLCSQIIPFFLNSMICTNQKKKVGILANCETLISLFVVLM